MVIYEFSIKQFETTLVYNMEHIVEIDNCKKTDYKSQLIVKANCGK